MAARGDCTSGGKGIPALPPSKDTPDRNHLKIGIPPRSMVLLLINHFMLARLARQSNRLEQVNVT